MLDLDLKNECIFVKTWNSKNLLLVFIMARLSDIKSTLVGPWDFNSFSGDKSSKIFSSGKPYKTF